MPFIKPLPKSNFYAVIFSSTKSDDLEGYAEMDEKTLALAQQQPGYLGYESVNHQNSGIFISYWESREAIENWRKNATHQMAKSNAGKWYKRYLSQVCLVESSFLLEQ
jgi:heme-degrading monooxygenase HmoA